MSTVIGAESMPSVPDRTLFSQAMNPSASAEAGTAVIAKSMVLPKVTTKLVSATAEEAASLLIPIKPVKVTKKLSVKPNLDEIFANAMLDSCYVHPLRRKSVSTKPQHNSTAATTSPPSSSTSPKPAPPSFNRQFTKPEPHKPTPPPPSIIQEIPPSS